MKYDIIFGFIALLISGAWYKIDTRKLKTLDINLIQS